MDETNILNEMEVLYTLAKVSVIIPVYNVEEYLAECLESVVNQTYSDLEILCINDHSTDNSLLILKKYAQKDSRIVILENEENKGQAYSRNRGLKGAKGEYILFVDSDDTICLDLVECCIRAGYGMDMVCFDYRQIIGTEAVDRQFSYKMKGGFYRGDVFFSESVFHDSIIFAPWSKFFSTRFLLGNQIFFHEGIIYEDVLFSFQCYVKAKTVYSLNRKFYTYRIRKRSTMTMNITGRNIECYIFCICELTKLYLHTDFEQQMCRAIEGYIQKVSRDYVSIYRRWGDKKLEPEILKDKPQYLKLFQTFSRLFVNSGKLLNITSVQVAKMKKYSRIVLYGAGEIARSTIEILDQYDIPLCGIAVSNGHKDKKSLLGNSIRELQDYSDIKEECLVLIGTLPRYYNEIRKQLRENGFLQWMEMIEVNDEEENER